MECIEEELEQFPETDRDDVVILFSAHSLPLKVCRFLLLNYSSLWAFVQSYISVLTNH